jgi:hypothetical protein
MVKEQIPIQLIPFQQHLEKVDGGYKVVRPLGDRLSNDLAIAADKAGYKVTTDKDNGWLLKEK